MVQRIDYRPSDAAVMRRRAMTEKYMTLSPQQLLSLLRNGDPAAGTTAAQETRRMIVFCVMAARGYLR